MAEADMVPVADAPGASAWLDLLEAEVPPAVLEEARELEAQGRDAADMLLARRLVPAHRLLQALSQFYNLPTLSLGRYHPDEAALALLPEEMARRFAMLPLFSLEERLYLALTNPGDLAAQDFVQQLTAMTVEPVLATRVEIEQAINRHYLTQEQSRHTIDEIASAQAAGAPAGSRETPVEVLEDRSAPVVKLVDHIFHQAAHLGASDVHLEPFARKVALRYRIDGMLHEFPGPPPSMYPAVVSRIKVLANLDIAERRKPQDGRTTTVQGGQEFDMRVSIIPNLHGEGIVIRLLSMSMAEKSMTDLGFEGDMLARWERLIRMPYGIVIVTGPTGSGKSTTLYATLRNIFSPARKMITLEDPVEYQLEGVTQIQVQPDIGFTFAEGLRAVLRHDPDICMIGEIRDLESAEIAIKAALTGHLLFATMHTNDSLLTVTRLVDMGIAPYKVLASLNGALAQRLVRRLCEKCKEPFEPGPLELASLGLESLPRGAALYRPVGCSACGKLGYRGRVAILELLEISPAMRKLKPEEVTPERLRQLAAGFVSLRQSALRKLLAGITSLDEVLALTPEEE